MVRKIKGAGNKSGGNQQDIIKQAQVMQQEMLKIQEGLKDKFVETSVAGGGITVKANGQKKIVDLSISLDVLKDAIEENDATIVSDLIVNAVNEILDKSEEMAEKIFSIQLKPLENSLERLGIHLSLSEEAKKNLAISGFSSKYGARQIAGVIRTHLTRPISKKIVAEEIKYGDTLSVQWDNDKKDICWQIIQRE